MAQDDIPAYQAMCDEIYSEKPEGKVRIKLLSRITGNYFPVILAWRSIFDNSGKAAKAVGVIEPVTARHDGRQEDPIPALRAGLTLMERYFRRSEESLKELRRYRHDRKNNLVALNAYLDAGDVAGAKEYLRKMGVSLNNDANNINTGNPAVDALISEKLENARRHGIHVTQMVGLPPDVAIDTMDLCLASAAVWITPLRPAMR